MIDDMRARKTNQIPEHTRIRINGRWLYLDPGATVRGVDGDSEQCEDCGEDIVAEAHIGRTDVVCSCGSRYPFDHNEHCEVA